MDLRAVSESHPRHHREGAGGDGWPYGARGLGGGGASEVEIEGNPSKSIKINSIYSIIDWFLGPERRLRQPLPGHERHHPSLLSSRRWAGAGG